MIKLSPGIAAVVMAIVLSSMTSAEDTGRHDMLLLLPDGPVHLRVHVTDDGKTLKQTRADYLTQLIASLDTDMDGKLSRSETAKHPLFVSGRRFEGNKFLDSLRSSRPYTNDDLELSIARAAGQLVTYRQNNSAADQDLSVFSVLDEDESGLIDRFEMQQSPARIADRDSDFDQCVTFDEFMSVAPPNMQGVAVSTLDMEPPGAIHSELLRDATEPVLAARLVRRYDTDRDAHLTDDELGWTSERLDSLDSDGDGKLNMQELSHVASAPPDLSLRVDLHQSSAAAMRMEGGPLPGVEVARSDLILLKRDGLSLSVGYRQRDPMAEASANAAATFNAIDVDANGYLDRDEITEHQRFARYLFDAMDRDDDDRVFAEEMMAYVKQYTEPASTTCQVTLLDNGNGFFQILDANADGRISIRELRACEAALVKVAGPEAEINPSQLTKSYRIEIQRGGVSLFGRVDRPSADTPEAFLKPPSGPIWYQRMDRNGDGDLTWDEFLGPREVFHQLDTDHDDLIDETEATNAMKDAP